MSLRLLFPNHFFISRWVHERSGGGAALSLSLFRPQVRLLIHNVFAIKKVVISRDEGDEETSKGKRKDSGNKGY